MKNVFLVLALGTGGCSAQKVCKVKYSDTDVFVLQSSVLTDCKAFGGTKEECKSAADGIADRVLRENIETLARCASKR